MEAVVSPPFHREGDEAEGKRSLCRTAELVSQRAVTQSYIYPHSGHAFLADDILLASRIHSNPTFKLSSVELVFLSQKPPGN